MKVALVYPEVYDLARFKERRKEFPPFGVLYLAAFLEKNCFKVDIFKVSQGKVQCDFRSYDIVGFSIPSSTTYSIIKKTRFESLYFGNPIIAVGGVHPSFYPEETLIDFRADVVVIGEGEKTLLEIVRAHAIRDFSQINGICYTRGRSAIITQKRIVESSID